MTTRMLMIALILCAIVGVVIATPALADDRYFCEISGQWDVEANWCSQSNCTNCGDPPDAEDTAIILDGNTCTLVTTELCETLIVQEGAELDITSTGVLQIQPGLDVTATIDGTVELTGDIEIDFEGTNQEFTFAGIGEIVGMASSAEIMVEGYSVPEPNYLVNSMLIRGILTIGRLDDQNISVLVLENGLVHADTAGIILIEVSGLTDRAGTGNSLLKVSESLSAGLAIDLNCGTGAICVDSCLSYTDVDVFKGTFLPFEPFETEKRLRMRPGGVVDMVLGGSFNRSTACD